MLAIPPLVTVITVTKHNRPTSQDIQVHIATLFSLVMKLYWPEFPSSITKNSTPSHFLQTHRMLTVPPLRNCYQEHTTNFTRHTSAHCNQKGRYHFKLSFQHHPIAIAWADIDPTFSTNSANSVSAFLSCKPVFFSFFFFFSRSNSHTYTFGPPLRSVLPPKKKWIKKRKHKDRKTTDRSLKKGERERKSHRV